MMVVFVSDKDIKMLIVNGKMLIAFGK